jgi:CRP-like cAMP-binding protein
VTTAICWDVFPLQLPPDLKQSAVIRRFEPGEDLFLQGDKSGEIYALLSGRTKAWRVKEDGVMCTMLLLGPSEIVGAIGMMQGEVNPVSVTALDKVIAACWPVSRFREALRHDIALANLTLQVVARRAEQMTDRFDDVAGLPVEERLARLLLRLSWQNGRIAGESSVVLKLRQQDLADMCFTTVPTVSRTLTNWEKDGVVASSRGRIRIPRLSRIAELTGLDLR